MNAELCEKCHEQTATVYLTLIEPSVEAEKHRFCETCFSIFQEERVTIQAVELGLGRSIRCKRCTAMVLNEELDKNLKVCPHCQFHFRMAARERIHSLVEPNSFEELDADITSMELLHFTGIEPYASKLALNQSTTGLKDAIITGIGKLGEHRVCLGALDFGFLGGSMGSVMGERFTRLVEKATRERLPVVIISASGGVRLHEGTVSLMQMAKTCGALARHGQARLPFFSVLTDPTMAGVLASFASLGALILAEPAAMIGFANPKVINAIRKAELPPGFQTAEFLRERGLIDAIIPRPDLKRRLNQYLNFMTVREKSAEEIRASRVATD